MSVLSRLYIGTLLVLGGCWHFADREPERVDAPPPPDACEVCGCDDGQPTDGGNLFLEYIHVDSELQATRALPGSTEARAVAFFLNAQTPQNSPFVLPGQCNNLEATHGWPLYVGSPHVDLDVGTLSFTGANSAGDAVTIPMTKLLGGTDDLGRPHDVFYQNLTSTAADVLQPDSAYSVVMSGGGPIAATTFVDRVFVPHDFAVVAPALEDNGPLVAGTDYPVTWTPAISTHKESDEDILGLVWLSDVTGKPSHVCVTLHGIGQFTIPGVTIAEYRANAIARGTDPDAVILSRQAVAHRTPLLPNGDPSNCRRIDMLGTNTWMQRMDVSGGPAARGGATRARARGEQRLDRGAERRERDR